MRAVLRTLAQCHSQHILHRDIKPGAARGRAGGERHSRPVRCRRSALCPPGHQPNSASSQLSLSLPPSLPRSPPLQPSPTGNFLLASDAPNARLKGHRLWDWPPFTRTTRCPAQTWGWRARPGALGAGGCLGAWVVGTAHVAAPQPAPAGPLAALLPRSSLNLSHPAVCHPPLHPAGSWLPRRCGRRRTRCQTCGRRA